MKSSDGRRLRVVVTTRHAQKRIRARFGVRPENVGRWIAYAMNRGVQHHACSGRLRHYLERVLAKEQTLSEIYIYGAAVLLIRNDVLITVLQLPDEHLEEVPDRIGQ